MALQAAENLRLREDITGKDAEILRLSALNATKADEKLVSMLQAQAEMFQKSCDSISANLRSAAEEAKSETFQLFTPPGRF